MREAGGVLLGIVAVTVCCGSHLLLAGGVAGLAGVWFGDGSLLLGVAVIGVVLLTSQDNPISTHDSIGSDT